MEYLSLSRNSLCEGAGQLLGPAISENSCLKELDLSWNQLRRRGAVAVANGIKVSVRMTSGLPRLVSTQVNLY